MELLNIPLPEEIAREEGMGNFACARGMIEEKLKKRLPKMLEERLRYELERIERFSNDFTISEKEAKRKLFESIKGFTEKEYAYLFERGFIDYVVMEGEKKFERRFFDNVIFALPAYKKRIEKDREKEKAQRFLHRRIDDLISGGKPKTYRIVAEIKISPKTEKIEGKRIRCWLPFPKIGDRMLSAKLLECSHNKHLISSNGSQQRTIYMEDRIHAGKQFRLKFEYTVGEQTCSIDPKKVRPPKKGMSHYLEEKSPHILFTPYIKNLADETVGEEENPCLIAKKIYDWITLNVRYSFMHAYSVYGNLSEFCASNLKGDCGVQALLFMTLCRAKGVPTSWQSGWYANPYRFSPHDWALFYVEPYGWLPADLSFGGARKDRPKYREFYFGNLDACRMVCNSGFQEGFTPQKRFWRSDPYDNQVGELETEKGNVYYDAFEHEIRILSFDEVRG